MGSVVNDDPSIFWGGLWHADIGRDGVAIGRVGLQEERMVGATPPLSTVRRGQRRGLACPASEGRLTR